MYGCLLYLACSERGFDARKSLEAAPHGYELVCIYLCRVKGMNVLFVALRTWSTNDFVKGICAV